MKVTQAIESYEEYHRLNSNKNMLKNYEFLFKRFQDEFGDRKLDVVTPEEILSFFNTILLPNIRQWRIIQTRYSSKLPYSQKKSRNYFQMMNIENCGKILC